MEEERQRRLAQRCLRSLDRINFLRAYCSLLHFANIDGNSRCLNCQRCAYWLERVDHLLWTDPDFPHELQAVFNIFPDHAWNEETAEALRNALNVAMAPHVLP